MTALGPHPVTKNHKQVEAHVYGVLNDVSLMHALSLSDDTTHQSLLSEDTRLALHVLRCLSARTCFNM